MLGSIDSWGGTDLDGVVNPVPGAAAAATATTTTTSAEDRGGGAQEDWRNLPRHRDEDQVKLDVDRSFVYYPNGMKFSVSFSLFLSLALSSLTPHVTIFPHTTPLFSSA